MIRAKLELHMVKVGRFSIGWFMLAARRVRVHLDPAQRGVKHSGFCCFKGLTYMSPLHCGITCMISFFYIYFCCFFKSLEM